MEDGSGRENQSQILNSCECQGGSLDLIPQALLKRCEPLGVAVRTTITVEVSGGSVVCTAGCRDTRAAENDTEESGGADGDDGGWTQSR